MQDSVEYKRLYWHSRRGMLELDLILVPFFEQCYHQLDQRDQQGFQALLAQEDQDLFSWFLGREQPSDKELSRIVEIIRTFSSRRSISS